LAQTPLPNPIPIVISGPGPWIDVKAYGAKGTGTDDDSTAIQNAIAACPPNGCTIYFPSSGGTGSKYLISSGLTITTKGVKLLGECGAIADANLATCSHLISSSAIVMLTVGAAHTPFDSGLVIQDLGFQDTSKSTVTGAIALINTLDFTLINVHCRDISIGYCLLFNGSGTGNTDFTQFGVVINPKTVDVKYPVQIGTQTSEVNFFGGDFNCSSTSGAAISGSIGMDLRGAAGSSAGGEFGVFGTHMINCLTGISMFNMANLNFYGIIEMPNGATGNDGIIIDGDSGHADKNTIAGSIDGFLRGVTLGTTAGATTNNRVLANITNTATPIKAGDTTALSTAVILTPINYPAGSGGVAIGTQVPDLTIPEEDPPAAPVTGSRRVYVDKTLGADDHLTAMKSNGTTVDLESGWRNYQAPLPAITGNGATDVTVYTFSVPPIPKGKGIRATVFWKCAALFCGTAKTFKWKFGSATTAYTTFTDNTLTAAYTQVRIFTDPSNQTNNTLLADAITVGTTTQSAGLVSSPNQDTSVSQPLTFLFNAASGGHIIPEGFIVEAIQ